MGKANEQAKLILKKYLELYTHMNEEQMSAILDQIPIVSYPKGHYLVRQGEVPTKCYFVLKGCVRQFTINEEGKDVSVGFFTEDQAVNIYSQDGPNGKSAYELCCLEDSILVEGDLEVTEIMYEEHPELQAMTRFMVAQDFGQLQSQLASFLSLSPEKRYLWLLENRPQLLDRVPQHMLASYLGITPESFSRIKKRSL